MLIKHETGLEIEGEGNKIIEASISKKNLPFIIDLITRQQYRDPIGSIVREITSNCFDANIKGNVDFPVRVVFSSDELGQYISFIDKGSGMSPQIIEEVYLSYGESDKRENINAIGGFGLGGKSPLSYTDLFYVITRFDGIEYEYIVHKGETLPIIELLGESPTDKRNGTEVKIYLATNSDRYNFMDACRKQLLYFDNVIIEPTYLFDNDYKIIEGKYFKFRSDITSYSTIHLCIGKVAYPIDWNILDIEAIRVPIALKFEIGELIVTPERESIRYVKIDGVDTKDIILDKLKKALEELEELYSKQDALKCDTIVEFLETKKKPTLLQLHGFSLDVSEIVTNKAICTKLPNLQVEFDTDIFNCYSINYDKLVHNGKGRRNVDTYFSSITHLNDTYYLRTKKRNKNLEKYLLSQHHIINVGKIYFNGYKKLYRLTTLSKREGLVNYDTNIISQLKMIKKAVYNEIVSKTTNYDNITVPESWLYDQKIKLLRGSDEVIVYDYIETRISHRKRFLKLEEVSKFTGLFIYGTSKDEFVLENFANLFRRSKYNDPKILKLVKTTLKVAKELDQFKNTVHVKDLINDNKVFKHFATSIILQEEFNFSSIIESLDEYYQDSIPVKYHNFKKFRKFIKTYGESVDDLDPKFKNAIIKVARQYNLVDEDIYNEFKEFSKYFQNINLLQYIDVNNESLHLVIEYLLLKGKEVLDLWVNLYPWEKELIVDSIDKGQYLLNYTYLKVIESENNRRYYHSYKEEDQLKQSKIVQKQLLIFNSLLNFKQLCQTSN